MLTAINVQLAALDRFWRNEQTKAAVEIFILNQVFTKLPTPPFTAEEKDRIAGNIYTHVLATRYEWRDLRPDLRRSVLRP